MSGRQPTLMLEHYRELGQLFATGNSSIGVCDTDKCNSERHT